MNKIVIIVAAVLASGCAEDVPVEMSLPDQCLRAQLFQQCMNSLPEGPKTAGKYNDWDEVVEACASSSYFQSIRRVSQIEPECAP